MSDRMEEIKQKHDNVCPTPQTVGDWNDEKWLIAEVERLSSSLDPLVYQEQIESLQSQLEAVTKERDKWKEKQNHRFESHQKALRKCLRLKAENAELKAEIRKINENRLAERG